MVDTDTALTAWHERLFAVLMVLEDIELRGTGFVFDYSRESLADLERRVGEAPGRLTLVEGAAAYLGEALMRVAGGAWAWSAEAADGFPDGVPLATADPALGLDPVSPVTVVRQGGGFVEVYDRWAEAVRERRQADDGWRPVKEPTEVDDPDPGSVPLTEWLSERAAAAEEWARTFAPDEDWDFSPDSLTRLQALVRRVTPRKEDLKDPANRVFRDGAAWYLGEVLRRHVGGRWNYNADSTGDDSQPYLEALGPRRHISMPVVALRIALRRDGYLRQHLDDLTR